MVDEDERTKNIDYFMNQTHSQIQNLIRLNYGTRAKLALGTQLDAISPKTNPILLGALRHWTQQRNAITKDRKLHLFNEEVRTLGQSLLEALDGQSPSNSQLPAPDYSSNILRAGDQLEPGQALLSPNRRYTLVLQDDGNLVLYMHVQRAVWATGTDGKQVSHAIMQDDGNFVLYHHTHPVWATETHNNPGAWFALQDDRNVVIYGKDNKPLWSSDTYLR